MAPLAETMASDRRLFDELQRSKSLSSIKVDAFDGMASFAEDSFDMGGCSSPKRSLKRSSWFGECPEHPFTPRKAEVDYDCFGFAVFELEADTPISTVKPTRIKTIPVIKELEDANDDNTKEYEDKITVEEKTARKARRRRGSLGIGRSEPGPTQMRRRRSSSSLADALLSPTPQAKQRRRSRSIDNGPNRQKRTFKEPGSRMKRSSSSCGMSVVSMPEVKPSASRMRRCKSSLGVGASLRISSSASLAPASPKTNLEKSRMRRCRSSASSLANHAKNRKRRSTSRKPKSASDAGRELMMAVSLDGSQRGSEASVGGETTKSSTRRRPTTRRLRKTISEPAKDLPNTKERRLSRSRRQELGVAPCSSSKRVNRITRSLTSPSAAVMEEKLMCRRSSSKLHF